MGQKGPDIGEPKPGKLLMEIIKNDYKSQWNKELRNREDLAPRHRGAVSVSRLKGYLEKILSSKN